MVWTVVGPLTHLAHTSPTAGHHLLDEGELPGDREEAETGVKVSMTKVSVSTFICCYTGDERTTPPPPHPPRANLCLLFQHTSRTHSRALINNSQAERLGRISQ